jgi:hypothetical protein
MHATYGTCFSIRSYRIFKSPIIHATRGTSNAAKRSGNRGFSATGALLARSLSMLDRVRNWVRGARIRDDSIQESQDTDNSPASCQPRVLPPHSTPTAMPGAAFPSVECLGRRAGNCLVQTAVLMVVQCGGQSNVPPAPGVGQPGANIAPGPAGRRSFSAPTANNLPASMTTPPPSGPRPPALRSVASLRRWDGSPSARTAAI